MLTCLGPRWVASAMSPIGARLGFAALASAVGEEVVDWDTFDDAEDSEEGAVASLNWPGLCAAEVVAQGYLQQVSRTCVVGRT